MSALRQHKISNSLDFFIKPGNYPGMTVELPAPQNTLVFQEDKFVRGILSGRSPMAAARNAGYIRPSYSAANLLSREDIRAAILTGCQTLILTDGGPAAIRGIIGIIRNKKTPVKVRLDAAKAMAAMAGFVAPKAPDATPIGEKQLHQMSREELHQVAEKARRILSDRAAPVIDANQTETDDRFKGLELLR